MDEKLDKIIELLESIKALQEANMRYVCNDVFSLPQAPCVWDTLPYKPSIWRVPETTG